MFFIFENCLNEQFPMNRDATNAGGWERSTMRAFLNGRLAKQLSEDLLESIEPMVKQIKNGMQHINILLRLRLRSLIRFSLRRNTSAVHSFISLIITAHHPLQE